jgi:hypothetical protein
VSAFGVVMFGFGVLMMWAGLKHQKINEVLLGFVGKPTVQTKSATTGTSGPQVV